MLRKRNASAHIFQIDYKNNTFRIIDSLTWNSDDTDMNSAGKVFSHECDLSHPPYNAKKIIPIYHEAMDLHNGMIDTHETGNPNYVFYHRIRKEKLIRLFCEFRKISDDKVIGFIVNAEHIENVGSS